MQLLTFATAVVGAFSLLTGVAASPAPQGVYDIIAPPNPPPPGCQKFYPRRFGFEVRPASQGPPPAGPPKTVCDSATQLSMTLRNGLLNDRQGRVGSIVANRQFQFDGPPAQAGAIYTAGWSICPDNTLALGDQKVFYRCKSGTFYNLYDESIGAHCEPIYLNIVHIGGAC